MDTSIFKYGELPEFKKFTPESIRKQFPIVLEKISEDFKNIEKNLSNYLIQNDLNWDKVINPLNCLLYTSPSPRDFQVSRMPSSA